MKVFKFGGGILNSPEAVRNIPSILKRYPGEDLILVISAFGKTTNAIEILLQSRKSGKDWHDGLERLRREHLEMLVSLAAGNSRLEQEVRALFDRLRESLESPSDNFNRDYDRCVGYGELVSSVIVQQYLSGAGIPSILVDARSVIRTDLTFRDAIVNLELSREAAKKAFQLQDDLTFNPIWVTQGFIGSGPGGEATTLGREGSDYSAALLANLLDAEEVIIWKDVPGILNADPALFGDAVKLDRISYAEATELAYYGAKVIHPRTSKPLQNKGIPLWVKSFFNPGDPGTLISSSGINDASMPSFIIKNDQILITISTRELAFISDMIMLDVFSVLTRMGMKVNLLQNSALTLSFCLDASEDIRDLLARLREQYIVKYNEGLTLVTIRHHNQDAVARVTGGREILLEQQNRTVAQFVVR